MFQLLNFLNRIGEIHCVLQLRRFVVFYVEVVGIKLTGYFRYNVRNNGWDVLQKVFGSLVTSDILLECFRHRFFFQKVRD